MAKVLAEILSLPCEASCAQFHKEEEKGPMAVVPIIAFFCE